MQSKSGSAKKKNKTTTNKTKETKKPDVLLVSNVPRARLWVKSVDTKRGIYCLVSLVSRLPSGMENKMHLAECGLDLPKLAPDRKDIAIPKSIYMEQAGFIFSYSSTVKNAVDMVDDWIESTSPKSSVYPLSVFSFSEGEYTLIESPLSGTNCIMDNPEIFLTI